MTVRKFNQECELKEVRLISTFIILFLFSQSVDAAGMRSCSASLVTKSITGEAGVTLLSLPGPGGDCVWCWPLYRGLSLVAASRQPGPASLQRLSRLTSLLELPPAGLQQPLCHYWVLTTTLNITPSTALLYLHFNCQSPSHSSAQLSVESFPEHFSSNRIPSL